MNTPTKITVSRIILVAVMLITLATLDIIGAVDGTLIAPLRTMLGNSHINVTAFVICIVFIIAASTDALDGYLARKNNQVTDLGKFLDPIADKLLVNSLLIFLCFEHSYIKNGYTINYWFVLLMVARDIIVDALRFIAASKNVVISANIFGKAKTVAQMITIPLVLLNGWPFSYFDYTNQWPKELRIVSFFVYITTILSVVSGIIYVVQNRKVLTNGSKKVSKSSK
ncbi:MAG: CDP-diacylglycerol--glycerol-3-phosphate 3-phosphatidyltransferase [Bacilli bacterium]|nr:CDP-diacylglycerol--glycerol-3-phosphate 3-phosphatidyltransferase [Bacilli bacterium]